MTATPSILDRQDIVNQAFQKARQAVLFCNERRLSGRFYETLNEALAPLNLINDQSASMAIAAWADSEVKLLLDELREGEECLFDDSSRDY